MALVERVCVHPTPCLRPVLSTIEQLWAALSTSSMKISSIVHNRPYQFISPFSSDQASLWLVNPGAVAALCPIELRLTRAPPLHLSWAKHHEADPCSRFLHPRVVTLHQISVSSSFFCAQLPVYARVLFLLLHCLALSSSLLMIVMYSLL